MNIFLKLTSGSNVELSHTDVKYILQETPDPSEVDIMQYLQENGNFTLEDDNLFTYFPNSVIAIYIKE